MNPTTKPISREELLDTLKLLEAKCDCPDADDWGELCGSDDCDVCSTKALAREILKHEGVLE